MTDHVKTLQKAREQMVKSRRAVGEVLSQPYDRDKTPKYRARFIEIQNAIDRIDKAIADEGNLNTPSSDIAVTTSAG